MPENDAYGVEALESDLGARLDDLEARMDRLEDTVNPRPRLPRRQVSDASR